MPSQEGGASKAPKVPRKKKSRRRRLKIALGLLLLVAAALGAGVAWIINLDLPDVRALEDYRPPTPTRVLAADGTPFHQFGVERRVIVSYDEIPPVLRNAIVAVEDANFFKHVGVDPWGIARAVIKDVVTMRRSEGASTLTQQLTRRLFLKPDKTFERKIREMVLAMQIERTYTKEEIFTFYCNQMYMGHGYYGVEAAAGHFFSRHARDLTLAQAATLAGILQTPARISPIRNASLTLRRRNHVLSRMLDEGYIDRPAYDAATKEPLGAEIARPAEATAAYFVEEIRRDLDAGLGQDALYSQGLTIETGLDLALQRSSEAALDRGVRAIAKRRPFRLPSSNILKERKGTLAAYAHPDWDRAIEPGAIVTGLVMDVAEKRALVRVGKRSFEVGPEGVAWTSRTPARIFRPGDLAPFLVVERAGALALELSAEPLCQGAVVALDAATGEIRALVGGLDFDRSQFDRAVQAQRQPGSAFKPIIYAAALEEGWNASDVLLDEPTLFMDPQTGVPYQPENYYREYNGLVTVRYALEHSLNIPTIRLLNMIGYQRAVEQGRRMGITSKLRPYPALGLGASEVNVLELAAAYTAFPNMGATVKPRLYRRVVSPDGAVVKALPAGGSDALKPAIAYLMTSLLKGVVARGTATEAAALGEEIAGKTGTTDENTDAWFVGYSPSLVLAVWVGKDDKEPLGPNETGAIAALPIWIDIMRGWLAAHPGETFRRPPGIETYAVDARTGLKADVDSGCSQIILEDFRREDQAPPLCSRQAHARARLPYYLQRYPWADDGTIAMRDEDLERIVRESPGEVAVDGSRLTYQGPAGPLSIPFRIYAPDDPALAALAGARSVVAEATAAGPTPRNADSFFGLVFPRDLTPIPADIATHPAVGLDGRITALVQIRYP
ncbi:MAG: PBP1A family penicillin-binding protein [Acidobacteria bacterium]|nr:PBP1A family penicillin-binding protein [Acidobacteriota bacterium]